MQGEQSELEVVRGARSFFAAPPLYALPLRSLGQRRGAEGGRWWAEGAQVELGHLVDSLCQQGHALLHRTVVPCQGQGGISVRSKRYHGNS